MTEQKQPKNYALGTQISPAHWAKLEQLKTIGINKNAVIEQGIDLVFEQMKQAGLIKNGAVKPDEGCQ